MNDLQRRMEELAGSPPPVPNRLMSVRSRIRSAQRRRAVAVAVPVVFVLVAGVVFARPGDNQRIVGEPTHSPSATGSPSLQASATPTASPSASASSPGLVATTRPVTPTSPAAVVGPGQTSAPPATSARPLSVELVASSTRPVTGQPVTFEIRVTDGDGRLDDYRLDFGDGTGEDTPDFESDQSRSVLCTTRDGDATLSARHRTKRSYRQAGVRRVVVVVRTRDCADARSTEEKRVELELPVGSGPPTTNGHDAPVVTFADYSRQDGELYFEVSDSDGYVSRVVVNWNDGSAPQEVVYPLGECRDSASAFPSSTRKGTLDRADTGAPMPTVTVYSTGCGGADEQASRAVTARDLDAALSHSPSPSG